MKKITIFIITFCFAIFIGNICSTSHSLTLIMEKKLKRDIVNFAISIDQYQNIGKNYDPEFFTYYGRIKAWVQMFGSNWGIGKAEWACKRMFFIQSINLAAHGTDRSIENLPNKNDSPQVFIAKMKSFLISMARSQKRSQLILEQGQIKNIEHIDLTKAEIKNLLKGFFKTEKELFEDSMVKGLFPNPKMEN